MWNEYMEWEDDRGPITFYDTDEIDRMEEGRDPQWEDSQPAETEDNPLALLAIAASIPIGMAGWALGNYVITPLVNKLMGKDNVDKKNETTEWVRANNKDKKQETTETLQSDDLYWEVTRRKTNRKNAKT